MTALKGKVALITGATSGIGAATAVHFASEGCKLALTGRNVRNSEKVLKRCIDAGADKNDILTIIGDLSKEEDVEMIFQKTTAHFHGLDILVNNAGIMIPGTLENATFKDYDNIMNINVRSLFQLSQLAIPFLKESKGNIVNVSSLAGLRSFPGIMAYSMSKAAVDQLTKCLALELAGSGVRVNSVNPGVIVTEIQRRSGMSEEECAKYLEHAKETHPLGRPGTAVEVAQSIAFLADEARSSFITGVILPIDGGRGVMCPR